MLLNHIYLYGWLQYQIILIYTQQIHTMITAFVVHKINLFIHVGDNDSPVAYPCYLWYNYIHFYLFLCEVHELNISLNFFSITTYLVLYYIIPQRFWIHINIIKSKVTLFIILSRLNRCTYCKDIWHTLLEDIGYCYLS